MKKIAIYCVTYHSYKELYSFLHSVEVAAKHAVGLCSIDVYVADNTEYDMQVIRPENEVANVHVFPYYENKGYMGSVQLMMSKTSVFKYDFVAISNVDLKLSEDVFSVLSSLEVQENVGWIAPSLLSLQLGLDKNPGVIARYSKLHLQLLQVMFCFPVLNYLYKLMFYKKRKRKRACSGSKFIYAGHGSFMILTKEFFSRSGIPDYAMFLFCEELYLAEKCRMKGLSVIYEPEIRLFDEEHVSVGKMKKATYYRYNKESLAYIIKTFYC